ncbi:MAG: hypothetical protein ACKO7N_06995 [Candidatus Nitrosotenuis sp.]
MRFTIYVSKPFEFDFRRFIGSQSNPSRRICYLVSNDLENLNINILRSILRNESERKKVKELLAEFEKV